MGNEEWRPVVGFEGKYLVSNFGNVFSLIKNKPFRPSVTEKGYLKVCLKALPKRVSRKVHALVAAAFIGPRPAGLSINHKDGNKKNNNVENLEYLTNLENMRHSIRIGLRKAAAPKITRSRHGLSKPKVKKLPQEIPAYVLEVKQLAEIDTLKIKELSKKYGLHTWSIRQITRGMRWAEIPFKYGSIKWIRAPRTPKATQNV